MTENSTIVQIDWDDMQEPQPVEPGQYVCTVEDIAVKNSKKGNNYVNARLSIQSDEPTSSVWHMMMLPNGEDAEKDNMWKLQLSHFLEACGMSLSPELDLQECIGAEIWCALDLEEDDEYGERNRVKRVLKAAS